ncbi:unnamed protein product [Tuber melanosporum]|uniref:(Perigord truffle) hypothetical protein n=1 Tax=Tuber melanosporum (strain Mel28) TaxID=656061 RepID=D5G848_TUBMM|nr:uncharacterized protein GSTUM_00002812001 [Tuber melanosporum]CAZ80691.1 unnamed protein product [Tuber melanosporum]
MEKLPPTPPKPSPPSSSTPPASLPPRPTPAQAPVRRSITAVIPPALPMGPRPKKFPAQGIGRGASTASTPSPAGLQGHASLPLKPGIPGTPLPRDTAAIVLAGGREGEEYSAPKKTYQVVTIDPDASSLNVNRDELATSQSRIMPPSDNVQQLQTPPSTTGVSSAEQSVACGLPGSSSHVGLPLQQSSSQQTALPGPDIESNGQATQSEHENLHQPGAEHGPIPNGGRSEFLFSSGHKSDIPDQAFAQHSRFSPNQQPQFYEGTHTSSFQPNRHFHQFASHDMPPHSSQYSSFGPPPSSGPIPHHPHFFLHAQNQPPMFYPAQYPFSGNITPPNTGSLLPPMPPFQSQGAMETSGHTSEVGSSTNPQTPFTPTHPFPIPPGLSHAPQHSYSPLAQPTEQTLLHSQPQDSSAFTKPQTAKPRQSSICDYNPRLRNISFIAPSDSDDGADIDINDSGQPHDQRSHTPIHQELVHTASQPEKRAFIQHESSKLHVRSEVFTPANNEAAQRLQSYTLGYFLNGSLADVLLVINGMGGSSPVRQYNAHSFILARSNKLHDLLQISLQKVDALESSIGHNRVSPQTSWADEMEHGNETQDRSEFRNHRLLDGKLTLSLEAIDEPVSEDSFLLALRSLYGASDWELDAFLDPTHPQHRTLEWTRGSSNAVKPSAGNTDNALSGSSDHLGGPAMDEEVRMLERSIELFAAGHLLGIPGVIQKANWGIRKWGMQLQGGAVERLLGFILEESESVGDGSGAYKDLKSRLFMDVIEFLVQSFPLNFRLNRNAPPSQQLCRFPKELNQLPKAAFEPTPNPESQIMGIYSTIILSVPFNILKLIVEHENFGVRNQSMKKRYDDAKAIIQERERRRKWCFRASQRLSTEDPGSRSKNGNIFCYTGGDDGQGPFESVKGWDGQEDSPMENLFWEESAFYAIGHGQGGGGRVEINRRKKGVPTVRALWKLEG